jgi:DNA-binding transcriptional MerR regulator
LAERAYLSIGDVLTLLREEFPDITISKIRFLESQGLLDPERTPSGYRKFYEGDVDRLRWILRQQRENFLPLKVIKGRLEDNGDEGARPDPPQPKRPKRSGAKASSAGREPDPGRHPAASARKLRDSEAAVATAPPAPPEEVQESLTTGPTGVSLTLAELAAASGLTTEDLQELETYGLLHGERLGGSVYYGEEALTLANIAKSFRHFGVEARHLRMYKNAADREVALFEQIVMPLLRQRNPEARRKAGEIVGELARLGAGMRASLLRHALRHQTGG